MSVLSPPRTLADDLERRRLAHRAARLELVVRRLRDRATWRHPGGEVPAGLREAVRDFQDQLADVERRRRELDR
ncbi:hypothetical protein [Conexibacter sp. SYSU D00693]|uniref:hypothetical protein n=1 Tax=Conexibacter sp. SYSU D00693 TaxID=2812560 RepID=UPI00196AC564|nr:hypothetical protein [Conexibacter sp. SYSU D00693]